MGCGNAEVKYTVDCCEERDFGGALPASRILLTSRQENNSAARLRAHLAATTLESRNASSTMRVRMKAKLGSPRAIQNFDAFNSLATYIRFLARSRPSSDVACQDAMHGMVRQPCTDPDNKSRGARCATASPATRALSRVLVACIHCENAPPVTFWVSLRHYSKRDGIHQAHQGSSLVQILSRRCEDDHDSDLMELKSSW